MREKTITVDVGNGQTAVVHIKRPEIGADISQAEHDRRIRHCGEVLAEMYQKECARLRADGRAEDAADLWQVVFASQMPN